MTNSDWTIWKLQMKFLSLSSLMCSTKLKTSLRLRVAGFSSETLSTMGTLPKRSHSIQ